MLHTRRTDTEIQDGHDQIDRALKALKDDFIASEAPVTADMPKIESAFFLAAAALHDLRRLADASERLVDVLAGKVCA